MDVVSGVKRKADPNGPSGAIPKRIKALDQDVVNKIAAGEIIVAPVHALKELIENAIDAGSTSLEILVKDGGLKLLQITDNGHGIDKEDLKILCERFTTSKLKEFEDLNSIGTYGFRGEALASISHIAHLTVTTKTQETSCAFRAKYADGKLTPGRNLEPCAGRQGTQITVEDLFYNVPTRRRAFRSASEEYAKILEQVGKYAVHCDQVAFSCKRHGDASNSVTVPANATVLDRIQRIHGSAVAKELLQLDVTSEAWGFQANGYISNANYNVKRTVLLLFINHRSVESSAVKKAIEQTYSIFLPKGGHPFIYLSLDIDPRRVDVNVHPTKREVNFLNEDEIIDKICEEIRVRLGNVDTSRTFMTQSVLPGVRVPTISTDTSNSPKKRTNAENDGDSSQIAEKTPQRTPGSRPYENNLVRTDSRAQKITHFMGPSAQTPTLRAERSSLGGADEEEAEALVEDAMDFSFTDREPTVCRLESVKELRAAVRETLHEDLTEVFSTHTFVGIVDHRRRLAAIQSGVRLLLVDYGIASAEYFYQLGLTEFANFGVIKLASPLSLRQILRIAAENKRKTSTRPDFDWDEVVETVTAQLMQRRDMLAEYFSLEISEEGELVGLPLLLKGYMPSMGKLPEFLLRLGPYVNWSNEKGCFITFLRELASWYVPEAVRSPPIKDAAVRDNVADDEDQTIEIGEDPVITQRRQEISHVVETLLFPAFKARLIGTRSMIKCVTEVANLKGLYRVFERC